MALLSIALFMELVLKTSNKAPFCNRKKTGWLDFSHVSYSSIHDSPSWKLIFWAYVVVATLFVRITCAFPYFQVPFKKLTSISIPKLHFLIGIILKAPPENVIHPWSTHIFLLKEESAHYRKALYLRYYLSYSYLFPVTWQILIRLGILLLY
jgi:hypothetical protein